jgi:hypothetical protein
LPTTTTSPLLLTWLHGLAAREEIAGLLWSEPLWSIFNALLVQRLERSNTKRVRLSGPSQTEQDSD